MIFFWLHCKGREFYDNGKSNYYCFIPLLTWLEGCRFDLKVILSFPARVLEGVVGMEGQKTLQKYLGNYGLSFDDTDLVEVLELRSDWLHVIRCHEESFSAIIMFCRNCVCCQRLWPLRSALVVQVRTAHCSGCFLVEFEYTRVVEDINYVNL